MSESNTQKALGESEGSPLADNCNNSPMEQLESAVAAYRSVCQQLEDLRNQMQEFVYIISHDLRAPLRAIKTLADWIVADYSDRLDQEGKEQLALLVNRVDRLNAMLEGILEYSRIGRVCEPIAQIDLQSVAQEVVDLISAPGHIKIGIGPSLPTIQAEPKRIRQVLEHLLTNAIRAIDKPAGLIQIACTDEAHMWHITVSDNGCGINSGDLEGIFKIFQTLAPKDQCPTTGVGLTLVKRIVEVHGGKIWAESQVGVGTTFHILWPKTILQTDPKAQAGAGR
ncbi:MAG: HAMP domain-containing sensor histidine kinase [Sedimentisphaerales bacterium]|nr:HAMP domain-containing sensor histidine kinase [Sedimentisphaerales bacterium]